jgi:hypothetical protein
MYRGNMDMSDKDPNRSNIFIPKLFSTVETIVPHYVDAIFGLRPYIPIEVTNRSDAGISDAQTDLLDTYLHEANFFGNGIQLFKYVTLFGTGYIEATPRFYTKKVKRLVPITSTDFNGQPVQLGMKLATEDKTYFGLCIRTYAPWEIYRDPSAKGIHDSRGIIKFRAMVSKRQLKNMAKGGYFPDFDLEKLDNDFEAQKADDWSRRMASNLGIKLPETDDDLGLWLSYESKDRYIDLWNFRQVLRDIPNPLNHGEINLTRIINSSDPNPATEFFGIGEGKPVEVLLDALNDNWNQTFNNHNMQNEGVIFYDDDAMNVDQLVMIAGNRIPVTPPLGKSIQDAVWERPTPGLSRDHYIIPEKLELMIDQTSGINDIMRGEQGGTQTAREAILRRSAGDSRMKLKIMIAENMGLKDFGEKAIQIIDQFATPEDIVSKLGPDRAALMPSANPADLDGSYNFAFKGSARMADAQIKRQDAKDIYQLAAGNGSIRQDWLADWLLTHFDVPDSERRKAVVPDEVLAQMQQMAQLQEVAAGGSGLASGGKGESTRAVSNGTTLGANLGYSPSGRDKNEKLSMGM